jgi:hypothetical protein
LPHWAEYEGRSKEEERRGSGLDFASPYYGRFNIIAAYRACISAFSVKIPGYARNKT